MAAILTRSDVFPEINKKGEATWIFLIDINQLNLGFAFGLLLGIPCITHRKSLTILCIPQYVCEILQGIFGEVALEMNQFSHSRI